LSSSLLCGMVVVVEELGVNVVARVFVVVVIT
jgi:hypothetical protein